MNYRMIVTILLILSTVALVWYAWNNNKKQKENYDAVKELQTKLNSGEKVREISKEELEKLMDEGKVIAKISPDDGKDEKEDFGWISYDRYRSGPHRYGGFNGRHRYPYFRYSGYPYWRFTRYPYNYLKYPYYKYGSPYSFVKYDGDYFWLTV